jgi:hypothetical protein
MRTLSKYYLGGLGVLLLAAPALARTYTSNFDIAQPTKVGNTELKPGDYVIKAGDGAKEMSIMRNGALVAQVPIRWTQLSKKSPADEFETNNGRVTQIKFGGRNEAIQLSN